MAKSKLSKHERTQIAHEIEDTLDSYCRADCPFSNHNTPSPVCRSCPISFKLQDYGARIDFVEAQHKPEQKPWTDEDVEYLIQSRKKMKLDVIAETLGRSYSSVSSQVRQLKAKGLI